MNGLHQSLEPFHLPTSCRQPRSHATRPRSSPGSPLSLSPSPGLKEGFGGATTSSSSEIVQGEDAARSPNPPPSTSQNIFDELEKERQLSNHAAETLAPHLPPGTVVWAKTSHHECWPAEVMDGRTMLDCWGDQSEGLVLVQLYGVWEYAWVDPVNDLSEFDHCFEERSKYSSRAFQDALNHALRHKEATSPDEDSDEFFGNAEEDLESRGKGKRARKPRLHFDDLDFPDNSVKRVRRTRIMRHLGLIAPAGSPFHQGHKSRRV